MTTYYAATNLNGRTANTGNRRWQIHAFGTITERDQFVRDYPTNDCRAVRRSELTDAEAEAAQFRAGV